MEPTRLVVTDVRDGTEYIETYDTPSDVGRKYPSLSHIYLDRPLDVAWATNPTLNMSIRVLEVAAAWTTDVLAVATDTDDVGLWCATDGTSFVVMQDVLPPSVPK